VASCFLFLALRQKKMMSPPAIARTTKPPIAAPTITPIEVFFLGLLLPPSVKGISVPGAESPVVVGPPPSVTSVPVESAVSESVAVGSLSSEAVEDPSHPVTSSPERVSKVMLVEKESYESVASCHIVSAAN
jgi:hypothetical protein